MSKKFKSLLDFLQGPVWNTPIMTFIEVQSAVFKEDEDHEAEYLTIFNNYKRLVDTMLGTYLEDMNITPEQFEEECKEANDARLMTSFKHSLFEQVWAAENFEIFKRMMTQKNIELELQALSMLQHALGMKNSDVAPEEDEILNRVLKQSKEEHEQYKKRLEKMDSDYQNAMTETLKEAERLDSEYQKSKQLMEKAVKLSLKSEPKEELTSTKSAPSKGKTMPSHKTADKRKSYPMVGAAPSLGGESISKPFDLLIKKKDVTDEEALLLRKKYLCEQRDKLVKQKQIEREKCLNEMEATKRPKSAKAAKSYMTNQMNSMKVDPHTLQMRRALAKCLKDELINQ